jgi:microcystin-dependent protein
MPLSRLENFLKNAEGNILYVNPSDFDATDSSENQGNSLTRPFKSIQRALIEAARFSYQAGANNDKIDRTTILVYPGTHYIDNRPGFSVEEINGAAVYKKRTGTDTWTETTLSQFNEFTNFDIQSPSNDLYKYNSISGGAILPRGTSIIGLDLRKTKIRPLYVPNPDDPDMDETSIFNVTGTCYFTAFSIFDADPTKSAYNDYASSQVVPNYSHHKVTTFAYADGVNMAKLGNYQTYLSDLDMYYFKVSKAYGDITGRGLTDYPTAEDFEPSVDEFRIVGSLDANPLGISSIKSGNGNGTGNLNIITVTTANKLTGDTSPHNLYTDSPFLLSGVTIDGASYNGSFTVKDVVGINTFTFITNQAPGEVLPPASDFDTATLIVGSDTVSSASPYIFNCSLRSVFGMNGMHADGNKATGFKSMVVAQYTGVSLQKDNNAFIYYEDGVFYEENTLPPNSLEKPLHTNSKAIFKPTHENFHIKASNNAFIQCVSIFAIGFAKHFITDTGGDMSITNSNSNFGNTSLESTKFKPESFNRDDVGYITHIIPPKDIEDPENEVSWISLDTEKVINATDISKLYIFSAGNKNQLPLSTVDGFKIGARDNDKLFLTVTVGTAQTTYSSPIYMPVPFGAGASARKSYEVERNNDENLISADIVTLTETHQFINGEKIRLISDTGQAPDGLDNEGIYHAITTGVGVNQLKIAQSLNDSLSNVPILGINNNGGKLTIVSRVSDKLPGEIGHPIQYDDTEGSWYITGSTVPAENKIYQAIVAAGLTAIGAETASAFVKRFLDSRSIDDKIYKIRYVIPKEFDNAKPPEAGYVIQESKTVGVTSVSYTNDVLSNTRDLRNESVIVNATASSVVSNAQVVTITTELPHDLIKGDSVKIANIRSGNNTSATGITSSYNGIYPVNKVVDSKTFQYSISGVSTNPGTFTNEIDLRNTRQQREALPVFSRDSYLNTYFIYRTSQVKRHIPGSDGQDGVYHLICLSSNISPSTNVGYDLYTKAFNQDVRNLYPQLDRDNLNTNPIHSSSFADLKVLGNVFTSDKRHSITRESLNYFTKNSKIGYALTSVALSGVGNTTITVFTDVEHNLNSIKSFTFDAGAGYDASAILFSRQLNNISSNGDGATVKITTSPGGEVSNVELLDKGSAYSVGDTLSVPGGSTNSTLTVTAINDATTTALELNGFDVVDLNDVFEVISVSGPKDVILNAPLGISTDEANTSGVDPLAVKSNEVSGITSIINAGDTTGIVTVTTSAAHGLTAGNKIKIVETGINWYDGDILVNTVVGLTTFTILAGVTTTLYAGATGKVLKKTYTTNSKSLGSGEENIGARASYFYDGITLYTNNAFDTSNTTITFADDDSVRRGDYYVVDNSEIIRVTSNSSPFQVLRGQFGTLKTTLDTGSAVRKIKVIPTELRRPSFMRASGHTFEYLGFGPGNYSTGMPQRQDRILSEDEVLRSQSKKERGGSVVYTGMNDLGEFFSGSKKLSSATGEETVIDAPIITYTGDDAQGDAGSIASGIFDEILVRRRITVEGGEGNNQTSQFYGPVNFTNKITNVSELGIQTKNLYLKGTASQPKLLTVGIATPTSLTIPSPKAGDISFLSNPDEYIGHVRTNNDWHQWGLISRVTDELTFGIDHLSVGIKTVTPTGTTKLYVDGLTRVNNLLVDGTLILTQPQSLGDVAFEDIIVRNTARFTNETVDPITGLTTTITMLHESGIQIMNDLVTTGIGTFEQNVYFKSNVYGIGAKFGNIRIGIVGDNEIDTSVGPLILDSDDTTGRVDIYDDVQIEGNVDKNVYLDVKTNDGLGISTSMSARIALDTINVSEHSARFNLGIGNKTGSALFAMHSNDTNYADGSFTIEKRKIGGSTGEDTDITNRGQNATLTLNTRDLGSDIVFKTVNTERLKITSAGQLHAQQTNNGTELDGHHLKLEQKGDGDVVLSFHRTKSNANIRWYTGIDKSDGNSFKIANPATTIAAGAEDFDRATETKLKIASTTGDTSILGKFDVGGNTISTPTATTFNLIDTNVTTLQFARNASTINMGNTTNTSSVTLRGVTQSTSSTTGALKVAGGVGIAKNLYVGGKIGPSVFNSTVKVEGTADFDDNVNFDGSITFKKTTDNTLGNSNTGAIQINGGVGIDKNVTIAGSLYVDDNSTIDANLTADKLIKFGTASTNGKFNFLRTDGSDSILSQQDFINTLGYVPQPPITITSYPRGNSMVLDDICSQFNNSKKTFNLRYQGVAFTPEGAANLLVSVAAAMGDKILKPGTDYIIPFTGSAPNYNYSSQIQFINAPTAGFKCYITALGGQGAIPTDTIWTKKGQIAVATGTNKAVALDVSANTLNIGGVNQPYVLTAKSAQTEGIKWEPIPQQIPSGTISWFAGTNAPTGWLICSGDTVPNGQGTVQGKTANFSALRSVVGSKYGAAGKIPDLRNRFVVATGSSYASNSKGGSNTIKLGQSQLPSHRHPLTSDNAHKHNISMATDGAHNHNTAAGGTHNHSASNSTEPDHRHPITVSSSGAHAHPASSGSGGSHRHNTTGSVGNGGGHTHNGWAQKTPTQATGGWGGGHAHNFNEEGVTDGPRYSGQGENGVKGSNNGGNTSWHPGHSHPLVDPGHFHSLSINNHNGHRHPWSQTGMSDHNGHTHPISIGNHNGHTHPANSGNGGSHGHNISMTNHNGHTHPVSTHNGHKHPLSMGTQPAHTHTMGNIGNADTIENRPQYIALLPMIKI